MVPVSYVRLLLLYWCYHVNRYGFAAMRTPCANTKNIKMVITCSMSDPKSQGAGEWTTATQAAQHKRKSSAIKLVPREFRSNHQRSFTHTSVQSLNPFSSTACSCRFRRDYRITPEDKAPFFIREHIHISVAAGRSEVAAAAKVKLCSMPCNVVH